jgi:hypothetical protein
MQISQKSKVKPVFLLPKLSILTIISQKSRG